MHGQKLTYQIQPRTHHAQKFPLRISVFYLLYFASGCNGQHDIINANDNLSFGGLFHPTPSSRATISRTYTIFFKKIVCDKTSVATNQARGTNEANTSKCWCWTSENGDGERFMLRKSGIWRFGVVLVVTFGSLQRNQTFFQNIPRQVWWCFFFRRSWLQYQAVTQVRKLSPRFAVLHMPTPTHTGNISSSQGPIFNAFGRYVKKRVSHIKLVTRNKHT